MSFEDDVKRYSDAILRDSFCAVNREKYLDRYEIIEKELLARGLSIARTNDDVPPEQNLPLKKFFMRYMVLYLAMLVLRMAFLLAGADVLAKSMGTTTFTLLPLLVGNWFVHENGRVFSKPELKRFVIGAMFINSVPDLFFGLLGDQRDVILAHPLPVFGITGLLFAFYGVVNYFMLRFLLPFSAKAILKAKSLKEKHNV